MPSALSRASSPSTPTAARRWWPSRRPSSTWTWASSRATADRTSRTTTRTQKRSSRRSSTGRDAGALRLSRARPRCHRRAAPLVQRGALPLGPGAAHASRRPSRSRRRHHRRSPARLGRGAPSSPRTLRPWPTGAQVAAAGAWINPPPMDVITDRIAINREEVRPPPAAH